MPLSRSRVGFLSLGTVVLVAACGGGAPPSAPNVPSSKSTAQPAPTPPPDVSPVPEPEGLVVVGRVSKPEAILKAAGGWAHLPLPGGSDLVRSITDDSVGDSVDLSQPIDGAVTVTGSFKDAQIFAAFAVAVKSFDDAKAKLGAKHKLTEGKNGSYWVAGIGKSEPPPKTRGDEKDRSDGDGESDDDETGCALAPASTGARLVCGDRDAVEALTPYLTRTASRKTFASDVHLEVRPGPLRQQANQLRGMVPILARGILGSKSPALGDMVDSAAGELVDFVSDTDRIQLDAQLGDAGAEATLRFDYQKANGLLAKIATSHPERADAPPAAFMHLPGDTDLALFSRGSDAKLFDHARELLGNLLTEVAEEGQMGEAERKSLRELVVDRMTGLFTGPVVYGKGFDQAALDKAVAARKGTKPGDVVASAAADRAVGEQVVGWHLVQVDSPITKVGPILKDWSQLWNRPAFAKWAKQRSSQKMVAQMRVVPAPAGVTLPKDTVHLEITFPQHDIEVVGPPPMPPAASGPRPKTPPPPAAKPKMVPQKPIVFHVIAVPDQGATWLGFGLDAKLLAQRAAAALSSAPDTGTLGKAPTGEALRSVKANGAWFTTLRGLLVFAAFDHTEGGPFAALSAASNKGNTPIVLTFAAQPPSQGAPAGSAVSTFKLPRGAIEDAVRIVFASR